jgi:hypothetical protein
VNWGDRATTTNVADTDKTGDCQRRPNQARTRRQMAAAHIGRSAKIARLLWRPMLRATSGDASIAPIASAGVTATPPTRSRRRTRESATHDAAKSRRLCPREQFRRPTPESYASLLCYCGHVPLGRQVAVTRREQSRRVIREALARGATGRHGRRDQCACSAIQASVPSKHPDCRSPGRSRRRRQRSGRCC